MCDLNCDVGDVAFCAEADGDGDGDLTLNASGGEPFYVEDTAGGADPR